MSRMAFCVTVRATAYTAAPSISVEKGRLLVQSSEPAVSFPFDRVFQASNPESVYNQACASLVEHVLEGRTACCVACGTEGSGRIETLAGTTSSDAVLSLVGRAVHGLLKRRAASSSMPSLSLLISLARVCPSGLQDLIADAPGSKRAEEGEGSDDGHSAAGSNCSGQDSRRQSDSNLPDCPPASSSAPAKQSNGLDDLSQVQVWSCCCCWCAASALLCPV